MQEIFDFFKFRLNEMLKTTLPLGDALNKIEEEIYFINEDGFESKDDFIITVKSRFINIELKNTYTYDEILAILSTIFSTGYFVCQYFLTSEKIVDKLILDENEFLKYWKKPKYKNTNKYSKNIISFKLICEPKWDNSTKVNNVIYHVTESENIDSILKYGLIPKSGKKKSYHPDRIYFSLNMNDVGVILRNLKKRRRLWSGSDNSNYSLFEISTQNLKFKSLNAEYDVVFYKDPNSEGVYTYDKIEPENISLVSENIKDYI